MLVRNLLSLYGFMSAQLLFIAVIANPCEDRISGTLFAQQFFFSECIMLHLVASCQGSRKFGCSEKQCARAGDILSQEKAYWKDLLKIQI